MFGYLCILIFLLIPTVSYADVGDKWLCVANKSTGFNPIKKGQWDITKFRTETKWLLEEVTEFKFLASKYQATLKPLGGNDYTYNCNRDTFFEIITNTYFCGGVGRGFRINTETLRYIEHHGGSYVSGNDEGKDKVSAYLEIGTCTKLE